jgi:predicted TIM-barrel fold metal-dependent hydrolase
MRETPIVKDCETAQDIGASRKLRMRRLVVCGWLALVAACSTTPHSFTAEGFAKLDKIDVHVHINTPGIALIEQAQADHFRLLTINVDYPDFPPIAEQARTARELVAHHPEVLAYAATFSMDGWDQPDWQQHVIRQLDAAFTEGAVAVKVWKNIGMSFRDANGRLVMIDDPKFDPVFDFIRERNKVLIGHQGEPRDCWLPMSEMTVNGDKQYFKEHPQYYMYLHPELPSYEQQIAARDRMLDRNPRLKFDGAHMASLEWSVDRLAAFLDRYPNTVVDLAARMGQMQFQSNQDLAKVRRFFIRYQDRLLYGTDLSQEPRDDPQQVRSDAHSTWLLDWQYLATGMTFRAPELLAPVHGLNLPDSVVRKIYSGNAERWFGNPWQVALLHLQESK